MISLLLAALFWQELPELPRALGGQFVGTAGGTLVVAGGTYWDGTPWSGGTKHCVDTIYALNKADKQWRPAGRLPEPLAYGANVSLGDSMLLIGGQSGKATHGKVFRLSLTGVEALPSLPRPCGWVSAASIGREVFVAGGAEGWPSAVAALKSFWKLDLDHPKLGWKELDPWPGPARFLAVMAAAGGDLYLAGGADLKDGQRVFLKDAYRFTPGKGWTRIADLPIPLQGGYAAPSAGRVLVLGGNDGAWADRESHPSHPGFSRDVFFYDADANVWRKTGSLPFSLVTSGLAVWDKQIVIAGGEDRPGSRSGKVFAGTPK